MGLRRINFAKMRQKLPYLTLLPQIFSVVFCGVTTVSEDHSKKSPEEAVECRQVRCANGSGERTNYYLHFEFLFKTAISMKIWMALNAVVRSVMKKVEMIVWIWMSVHFYAKVRVLIVVTNYTTLVTPNKTTKSFGEIESSKAKFEIGQHFASFGNFPISSFHRQTDLNLDEIRQAITP